MSSKTINIFLEEQHDDSMHHGFYHARGVLTCFDRRANPL